MVRFYCLIFSVVFMFVIGGCDEGGAAERTILLTIDGLHIEAPDRIGMVNFQKLKQRGCYYKAVHLPLPAHPQGDKNYPFTCSLPNPVMMCGTVFIHSETEMVQEAFGEEKTVFLTNSPSYWSISRGVDLYQIVGPKTDDRNVVNKAKEVIEKEEPVFIRVHMQATGVGGYQSSVDENKEKSFYHNIWHPESFYVKNGKKADKLLGEFVAWLESTGRMKKTVMIVTSDHGQTVTGGHPPYAEGGSSMPLLIFGTGINKGKSFEYAEITDIAPTIAYIHNVPKPKDSNGRVLLESIKGSGKDKIPEDRYIARLNKTLLEQHKMSAAAVEKAVTIETIAQWHERFGDMKSLVEYCEKVSADMKGGAR